MEKSSVIYQHSLEIDHNREIYQKRPLIRRIYHEFYSKMLKQCRDQSGRTVELGAGMALVKSLAPEIITTDLFKNPGIDQVEDVYKLTFETSSVDNFLMLDVFHHLKHPWTALLEIRRALKPGGRLVLLEPDMSLIGKIIYGSFHHEPTALEQEIEWEAPSNWDPSTQGYYAAQGNAWRTFIEREWPWDKEFNLVLLKRLSEIKYIASGGFSKRPLYPSSFYPAFSALDEMLKFCPKLFSTRLFIVLEKS